MSTPMVSHITECRTHHTGKPQAIGRYRLKLYILTQHTILMTDARGVEIEVHAPYPPYKCKQAGAGVLGIHINRCRELKL